MFCSNCGAQVVTGANFCPNCGAALTSAAAPVTNITSAVGAASIAGTAGVAGDNTVMILSLDSCPRATAVSLIQQLCGYTAEEAALIADSAPVAVARYLSDPQARCLAQALCEYGLEVAVCDSNGWRQIEPETSSVWSSAGSLLAGAAAALGLIGLRNRITRDLMRRWELPFRYTGPRPPVVRRPPALARRIAPPRAARHPASAVRIAPGRSGVHASAPRTAAPRATQPRQAHPDKAPRTGGGPGGRSGGGHGGHGGQGGPGGGPKAGPR